MDIIGLGFDATDIPRVREVFERYGDRFLHRVFTDVEIAYCTRQRDPVPSLAGRFAAKEAAMKALGTGHSRGVLWKDIEVVELDEKVLQFRLPESFAPFPDYLTFGVLPQHLLEGSTPFRRPPQITPPKDTLINA